MKMFEVTDIYLNSYLLSDNYKIKETKIINSDGKRKVAFYYLDSKELQESIKDYRENTWLAGYIKNYLFIKSEITRQFRNVKNE